METGLLEQTCNKLPMVFNRDQSKIVLLSKMQHYGIPTRLIDFTSNPLVALYFACQEAEPGKDNTGQIFKTNSHSHCSGSKLIDNWNLLYENKWDPKNIQNEANALRNIAWNYYAYDFVRQLICACIDTIPDDGMVVGNYVKRIKDESWFKYWAADKGFWRLSIRNQERCIAALLRVPLVVESQELIERQRLQQGKYLLIPNEIIKGSNGKYIVTKKIPKIYHGEGRLGHCVVRGENKVRILKELNSIGINEGFLFSDSIDYVCRQIKTDNCRPV